MVHSCHSYSSARKAGPFQIILKSVFNLGDVLFTSPDVAWRLIWLTGLCSKKYKYIWICLNSFDRILRLTATVDHYCLNWTPLALQWARHRLDWLHNPTPPKASTPGPTSRHLEQPQNHHPIYRGQCTVDAIPARMAWQQGKKTWPISNVCLKTATIQVFCSTSCKLSPTLACAIDSNSSVHGQHVALIPLSMVEKVTALSWRPMSKLDEILQQATAHELKPDWQGERMWKGFCDRNVL